jgi:FlaA1/EpsC-like NDP-sugar epimerase
VHPQDQSHVNGNGGARRPLWLRQHVALLVAFDALAAGLAGGTSRVLAFGLEGPAELPVRSFTIPYSLIALAAVPTWIVVLATAGAYDVGPFGAPSREIGKVVRAGATFLALIAVAYFLLHLEQLGREFLAPIVPLAVGFTLAGRFGAQLVLRERRRRGHGFRRAVVVGSRSRVADLVRHLADHRFGGLEPVAACVPGDRAPVAYNGRDVPVLGGSDAVLSTLCQTGADSVVVAGNLEPGEMRSLAWSLEGRGIDVLVVPTPAEHELVIEARPVAGLPLLYVDVESTPVDGGPRSSDAA